MSLRINTNVTALNALRNLDQVAGNVSTSIERLSSGLRINRALVRMNPNASRNASNRRKAGPRP